MSNTPSQQQDPSAAGSAGATSNAAFSTDPRVHFSRLSGKWEFEDDDGNEFEWSEVVNSWVPILDEEIIKAQQAAYSVAGVDENAPAAPVLARENKKRKDKPVVDYTSNTAVSTVPSSATATKKAAKRARPDPSSSSDAASGGPSNLMASSSSSSSASSSAGTTPAPEKPARKSTAVFITNLPLDATKEEIQQTFSKCGIILLTPSDEPKIKMYTDEAGIFKGEALVMYFKETSVDLAITVLNDSELRLGEGQGRMKVRRAEWGDGETDGKKDGSATSAEIGEKKKEKRKMTEAEKKELSKRIRKMESKLTDWDSDSDGESERRIQQALPPPNVRLVVLKHMFTLDELEADATLLIDLKEDVREEAESMGEVTSVTLFDREEEGIMTVKFKDPIAARACVLKFNGRYFAQRRIEASLHDGRSKFRRSGTGAGGEIMDEEETEKEEKARLEKFREYLEQEESA
ncbi:Transcription elongation factor TAT-SF1 [Phaffia rhodozyma]|uniref:Transcription elongation factor TAT-SF1 n=1 Tax=Phaffia rhodozyma TaxID=264483 RepID=A0A0F7SKB5_PHARH|nr:Transcription elongation factor TAT-SF1 [Phaffia rhodozyma]